MPFKNSCSGRKLRVNQTNCGDTWRPFGLSYIRTASYVSLQVAKEQNVPASAASYVLCYVEKMVSVDCSSVMWKNQQ